MRYWSVLGGRIRAARGSLRENVAGNGGGIDREMGLNFLQSTCSCVFLRKKLIYITLLRRNACAERLRKAEAHKRKG